MRAVNPLFEVSEGIGSTLSLTYLGALLSVLLIGAYIVSKQVLVRIGMDESIKKLGDTIRTGDATSEVRKMSVFSNVTHSRTISNSVRS